MPPNYETDEHIVQPPTQEIHMNTNAYNKGQSVRININHSASTVANTARDASISVLSFLKGVLASPHAVPSAKPRAKAKTAAKRK